MQTKTITVGHNYMSGQLTASEDINQAFADGWQLDPRFSHGAIVMQNSVIYHLVKFSAEEVAAQAQAAAAQQLAAHPAAPEVESLVSVEIKPVAQGPAGSDGVAVKGIIDQYLDAGYKIDDREMYAAKSTKYVTLYKPKAQAPASAPAAEVPAGPAISVPVSPGFHDRLAQVKKDLAAQQHPAGCMCGSCQIKEAAEAGQ